ncbi:hypothetical protein N9007_00165 [bacterium]|jgi:hypothetical protein|nr:hypothetical protein [bacterium]MDB4357111.1 hypothetical protein [Mariniblastus sp.]MDB4399493.1 hypothetical protein [bacterium]
MKQLLSILKKEDLRTGNLELAVLHQANPDLLKITKSRRQVA